MDTLKTRRKNRRRRESPILMRDISVPSPCIAVCTFDGTPFCKGCYRTADEIREWMVMTQQQKLDVLSKIDARKAIQPDSI